MVVPILKLCPNLPLINVLLTHYDSASALSEKIMPAFKRVIYVCLQKEGLQLVVGTTTVLAGGCPTRITGF